MIFRNWVLENFPFLEDDFDALTDYELFCKMVEYMRKSLEHIKTYDSKFIEIDKRLTDLENYLDNLDLQDEVNNKLDEMAESGELADIIAQYLGLAGVLAFNTVSEMIQAENLVNGSICRTLGESIYNDGKGNFYKIRTITSGDVVDGVNIIALNISTTLIAEKIIKDYFNLNYYLGAFHKKYSELDKKIYLFLSNDAINFTKIPNIEISGESSSGGGDPSILYDEETKTFLIAYSNQDNNECFTILKSKDLINWDEYPITLTLPQDIQGWNKWAPTFFRDNNGSIKLIFSADKTQNGFDFENLITELTDVENLTFTNPYKIVKDDVASIYDCSIQFINNKYYMVATDFNVIKLYTSNDLINFTLINNNLLDNYYLGTNNERALEGCKLSILNDKLMLYCEIPNIERYIISEIDLTNNKILSIKTLNCLQNYKHGSVINIDTPSSKNILNNIAKNIINENEITPLKRIQTIIALTKDTTLDKFTIYPKEIIIINGNGHTLTINKIIDPYKLQKLDFIIYDENGKLIINQYESELYSNYEYTATIGSGKKVKTLDFRFNTLDNSYDYLALDSGVIELSLPQGFTGNIWAQKIGHVVNIQFNFNGTYSYGLLLATIPQALRPSHQISTVLLNRSYESSNEYLLISNDGGIVYLGGNSSGQMIGNITYLVN